MMRRFRVDVRLPFIAALVALTALTPTAWADTGGADDPDDTAGPLDVRQVSHANDNSTITYRFETYEPFALEDIYNVRWDFDLNGDGIPADACIILTRLGSTRTLRGGFFGECGPETWATADARILDGNALEITFPILDLVEGGGLPPGHDYGYRVTTRDREGNQDTAPEQALAAHQGVPKVFPREGSAQTLFGNPGTATGAQLPGRTQPTAEQGAPTAKARSEGGSFLSSVPIIGNLCSGSLCLLIGVGVPIAAIVLAWSAAAAYRTRRRPKVHRGIELTPSTPAPAARSHSGHLWFAPSFESTGSVAPVASPGPPVGLSEPEHDP